MAKLKWQFGERSENVHSYRWEDKEGGLLHVVFYATLGKCYIYKQVPYEVYSSMRNAKSLGGFVHDSLKGKFDYEVSEQECEDAQL